MNGEYFIKINSLYKEFNLNIESLSSSVANFWRDIGRESINVDHLQKMGV